MSEFRLTRRGALLGAAGLSLAACGERRLEPLPQREGPFKHGVASGDPDQTSLVVWTAVTGPADGLTLEVSDDPDFTAPRNVALAAAGEPVDDVTPFKAFLSGLTPGAPVWYRFRLGEQLSPAGRAAALPEGAVESFRIAAFSCSNYPAGFFNAYRDAAENAAPDLVVHLGDYLYEYARDGYASEDAARLAREVEPPHELLSYADYARRHAQYSADPDLQALKAAAPWILVWDDHETANNAWRGGAENHNEGEGDWETRRDAALRAWYAWTPTRQPDPAFARFASVRVGDLATLILLETRLTARDQEVSLFDMPIDPETDDPADPEARARVAAWLEETAGAPERQLLGPQQLESVAGALRASSQAGQPWRVFINQVIMGRVPAPDYPAVMPWWLSQAVRLNDPLAWSFMKRFSFGTPLNLDAWDGYAAERERLYAAAREANADFITLTGDTHNAWTLDLKNADGTRVGTEFGVTSVSSPSRFERLKLPSVDFGRYTEEHAPEVLRHNAYERGYLVLELGRDAAIAEHVVIDRIDERRFTRSIDSRWRLEPARGGAVPGVERIG